MFICTRNPMLLLFIVNPPLITVMKRQDDEDITKATGIYRGEFTQIVFYDCRKILKCLTSCRGNLF